MRLSLAFATTSLFLATGASAAAKFPEVSVRELAAHPEAWDGLRVEVHGLAVAEFEDFGLYSSYRAYCSASPIEAIAVDWDEHVRDRDDRRLVIVRGTFHNTYGVDRGKDGRTDLVISTGAPGPGPLQDAIIVRKLSRKFAPCRR